MRKTALLLAVITVLCLCASCGTTPSATSPSTSPSVAPTSAAPASDSAAPAETSAAPVNLADLKVKQDIIFATNPIGTGNYTFAAAGAAVWNSILGINVTVEPTTGADGCVYALEGGEDIAIVNSYYAKTYWSTVDDAYKNVRTLLVGDPLCFSFVINKDSGIKSISDLKGKRVTYAGLSQSHTLMATALLTAYGLTEQDVTVQEMASSGAGLTDLAEGRTDAVIASIAGSKMDDLCSKINGWALEIDPAMDAVIREKSDGLLMCAQLRSDVSGSYAGANLVASSSEIITTVKLDDDTSYALVRAFYENVDDLSAIAADLQFWTLEQNNKGYQQFPFAAGAVKFYKEVGVWTDELEKWQNDLLAEYSVTR